MYQNSFFNPYGFMQPQQQIQQQTQPTMQVVKVNGENGARAFQMGANSSALLLDESGTMIWLCTTDGASYKTVTAYDITPHQTVPVPDYGSLESRIKKLEEIINGNTGYSSANSKNKSNDSASKATDGNVKRAKSTIYTEQLDDD